MERLGLDDEVRMMSKEDTIREAGVLILALETYKSRLETLLPEHVAELREEYFEKLGMDPSFSRVVGSEMQFAGRKRKAGDMDAAVDPLSVPEVSAAVQRASFEMLIGFQMTDAQLQYNATR